MAIFNSYVKLPEGNMQAEKAWLLQVIDLQSGWNS